MEQRQPMNKGPLYGIDLHTRFRQGNANGGLASTAIELGDSLSAGVARRDSRIPSLFMLLTLPCLQHLQPST